VSVRPIGSTELGTKTELKNMNSFRFLERGVNAEIERQTKLLQAGGRIEQETLHFDPASGRLSTLRSKEEAQDYRYFPEPDLVPLVVTEEMITRARAEVPELPAARAQRFETDLGLGAGLARDLAFRPQLADYFELALAAGGDKGGRGRTRELDPAVGRADRVGVRSSAVKGLAAELRDAWPRWSRRRTSAGTPPARCSRAW